MTTASQTVITVELTDACGYPTGKSVPVWVDYCVEVDKDYGADADGARGSLRVEHSFLTAHIEPEDLKGLTAAEAEQALGEAETIFYQAKKYFY